VICTFANFETGECYPSIRTIAELSGTGTGRILEAIEELVRVGLLVRWSGNHTQSNRYKVTLPGVSGAETPRLPVGDTPASAGATGLSPQRSPNDIHVTTVNVTTTINNGTGGGLEKDRFRSMAEALALRGTLAQEELDKFIGEFGPEIAEEAVVEAVAQGKASMKYARGIAKRWKAAGGRIVHSTKAEAAREEVFERKSQEEAIRSRKAEEMETQYKARLMAEQKLTECAPGLLSLWQNELALEADRSKILPMVRDSWMKSKLLIRVAREFGIEGL
jgi:DnaD/phage-associated family protein